MIDSAAGNERLLVLNAGSSSLKFGLYRLGPLPVKTVSGKLDRIGSPRATFTKKNEGRDLVREVISAPDHKSGFDHVLEYIAQTGWKPAFTAVAHRIVHGGPNYLDPKIIDQAMLMELRRIRSFDPEHLPAEVALVEAIAALFPVIRQIACFDTAFHADIPRLARLLPIPRRFEALGLHRYGFHGLSYAFILQELQRLAGAQATGSRLILAHLGNGASMAAIRDGRSVDTTMAFTPASGLMMGTRSGDLDPGLFAFLARNESLSPEGVDRMLNHESGLLGVSETSSDMRDLLLHEKEDARAADAVSMFCQQAKKYLGAYAAVLGGLDNLVFSGGIGENSPSIRARICAGLGFLGIELDELRNEASADIISAETSRVTVRIIRTDEELMIARSAYAILRVDG